LLPLPVGQVVTSAGESVRGGRSFGRGRSDPTCNTGSARRAGIPLQAPEQKWGGEESLPYCGSLEYKADQGLLWTGTTAASRGSGRGGKALFRRSSTVETK